MRLGINRLRFAIVIVMNPEAEVSEVAKVSIVVSTLVIRDGKYLMVQENIPEKGPLWHPPSGKVNIGEAFETAAVRWTKEQTGYDVRIIKEIGLYHEIVPKSIKHVYSAEIIGGDLKLPQSGILQGEWLPYAEIEALDKRNELRAPWVWNVIQKTRSHGDFENSVLNYL